MRIYILLFTLVFANHLPAQVGTGQWRDHLPYSETIDLCEGPENVVFCATNNAVFEYNQDDGSITRINKVNYLSGNGITAINYHALSKTLVVGYANGNIDLVRNNRGINVSDIERSNILANKSVNEIYFEGTQAFLACGFGIVVLDLDNVEISDTYIIGPLGSYVQVFDIANDGVDWYAATKDGLYTAPVGQLFLSNFESWSLIDDFSGSDGCFEEIEIQGDYYFALSTAEEGDSLFVKTGDGDWSTKAEFSGGNILALYASPERLFISYYGFLQGMDLDFSNGFSWGEISDQLCRANAILIDAKGSTVIANAAGGLIGYDQFGNQFRAMPDGPSTVSVRRIDAYNDNIWMAPGGADGAWVSVWNGVGTYGLVNEKWHSTNKYNGDAMFDLMDVTIDPTDNEHVIFGSWLVGLVELQNKEYVRIYDQTNSSLTQVNYGGIDRVAVGGVDFDDNGNLWFTNSFSNTPLHVRTSSGEFQAYSFGTDIGVNNIITEVRATRQGYIWAVLPNGKGLLVLDHNGTLTNTSDDQYRILTTEEGAGGLPIDEVVCIEEDLDEEIWVGMLQGLAVFYSPTSIFEGDEFDAQEILIEQDGNVQILLETETVSCIEIDGANRKWIGTVNSGVFLMSADGIEQIHHFTAENSPLPSNNVFDVAINHESGEVLFGTEKGIVGYKSDATNFYEEMTNVIVYPNPVRPDYTGLITIDGLSKDADVKVSDASGNVVYQTLASGGRATWPGTDFSGNRVSSGMYFVYISTQDGSSRSVAKVAFIN
ncbi:MAG: ligand-binding sensor domain-containing protein [Litorivivens sp.]|jgi:ligand-binding sensor domain-containing protein